MTDQRFLQDGFDKRLSHLIEECGEVLAAAGKTQRWGADSGNPLLPAEQQEKNIDWLRRELGDLKQAISRLEECLQEECSVKTPEQQAKLLAVSREFNSQRMHIAQPGAEVYTKK